MTDPDDVVVRARQALDGITIHGHPNYMVCADWSIWSVGTNWRGYGRRKIRPVLNGHGYLKVRLTTPEGRRNLAVHVLVAKDAQS